jgi:hypothetical protein
VRGWMCSRYVRYLRKGVWFCFFFSCFHECRDLLPSMWKKRMPDNLMGREWWREGRIGSDAAVCLICWWVKIVSRSHFASILFFGLCFFSPHASHTMSM